MKRFFILTIALLIFGAVGARAQDDEIYENKNAPANYDANLPSGAEAVGSIKGRADKIIIVSKSGGVYRARFDDGTDNVYLFRANAVYPYFDLQQFDQVILGKDDLITPYLGCYAKKRDVDVEKLQGDGFSPRFYYDDAKTALQNEQSKLAQIEAGLKTLAARPDTFLEYKQNPAVWYDIAANRAEYLPCALGDRQAEDIKDSPWLRAHRDGVKKVLTYVESYRAGSGDSMGTESEYALYAVSPKMRADWLKEKSALAFRDEVDKLLKPLADALAKKLPTYQPRMERYSSGTPADFAMMKRVLTNPARYKIFKTGLMQATWQIDKNSLGIPNARYKNGAIYLRDTQADHPYCYLTYVNIVQNYAGGGTYAASEARFIQDELVACPSGATK